MQVVRVMLAHNDEATLASLRKVIESDTRMAVVGTSRLGEDCVFKAAAYKPSVLIMDLGFPDMGCSRVIELLSQSRLPIAVLICSKDAVKGSPQVEQARQAGAFDFILIPPEPENIPTVGRQILTASFVASFSKTKQIPRVDPSLETRPEGADNHQIRLGAVLIDCAADRVGMLRSILVQIRPQAEPAVFVVLRQPPPAAQELVRSLSEQLLAQCAAGQDGDSLVPGQILVINQSFDDRAIIRIDEKQVRLRTVSLENARRAEPAPSPLILYESFGSVYGQGLAVVSLGRPSIETADALVAVRSTFTSLTLVEKSSTSLIEDLSRRFADQGVPDGIVDSEEIEEFINSVLVTGED